MERLSGNDRVSVWHRFSDMAIAAARIPLRSGHLAYLDGWRGLCILLVIVGHFVPGLGPIANSGVEFFFALSGRLMAEILTFKRQDIGRFLRRRVARVGPAIAVYVLLIGSALNTALWLQGQPLRVLSPLAALFFFHNYLSHDSAVAFFEHTWSLAVEEHAYLLLAVIVLLARRRPLLCAAIALGICMISVANAFRILALPYNGGQFPYWRSDIRVGSVLLSFAMYILMRGRAWNIPAWASIAAAVAAVPLMFAEAQVGPLGLFACSALAAVAVNGLSFSGKAVQSRLASPVLVWFGTLSFSIYVWQQLFYVVVWHAGAPAIICIPLLLACAVTCFKLVEDPARNFLNECWTGTGLGMRISAALAVETDTRRLETVGHPSLNSGRERDELRAVGGDIQAEPGTMQVRSSDRRHGASAAEFEEPL